MRNSKVLVDKKKRVSNHNRRHRNNQSDFRRRYPRRCISHLKNAIEMTRHVSDEDEHLDLKVSTNQQNVQLNPLETRKKSPLNGSMKEENTSYQGEYETANNHFNEIKSTNSSVAFIESSEESSLPISSSRSFLSSLNVNIPENTNTYSLFHFHINVIRRIIKRIEQKIKPEQDLELD